jgi:hypothetical protein
MDIVDELLNVVRALEAAGAKYAVCGGLAVAIHGRPRLTVDIDLIVPASEMPMAIDAAKRAGFDLETGWVSFPDRSLGTGRLFRLAKVRGSEFLTLDLLELASTENPIWKGRMEQTLREQKAMVLSQDGLITMKSSSDRTKDRLDIEMLRNESD